jgi:hypothetical protein
MVQSQPRQQFARFYLKKTYHKKGLVEWLKVKALSSDPILKGKKKRCKTENYKLSMHIDAKPSIC